MSKLRFLSGFTLGQLISKAIKNNVDPRTMLGEHYELHNSNWELFNQDLEFIEGLKVGLKLSELPDLQTDLNDTFKHFTLAKINC